MSEKKNLDTVRQIYAAFQSGDMAGFFSLLADDVEWLMPTVDGLPFTGNCRGRTQVEEFFRARLKAEEVLNMTQDEYIITGSKVAVVGRYRARVRATNNVVETPYAHVFTVADGKIHTFEEYYDTAAVADAYRQRSAADR